MDHYEIVTKLIGQVNPIGETNADHKRMSNLSDMIFLVGYLLGDISAAAQSKGRPEASMNAIGKVAQNFLDDLQDLA